jgi:hypothetical protein
LILEPHTEIRKGQDAGGDSEDYRVIAFWGIPTWTTIEVLTVALIMLFFGILIGSVL